MKYFKLGQTVYHYELGEGVIICTSYSKNYPILVRFKNCQSSFTDDGKQVVDGQILLSQKPITKVLNVPIEEYNSFTFVDNLLGKEVISKDKSCRGIITYQDEYKIIIGNYQVTYENLLKEYTFIGGKPCGND